MIDDETTPRPSGRLRLISDPAQSTARGGGQAFVKLCLRRLPAGSILNLGAGFTDGASPRQTVTNVDLDPAVLRNGRGVAADAALLPFPSNTFTGALLKDVLEHVYDPIRVLTDLRRVSQAGALVIVTVPRAIPRAVWADPTHLRGFTRQSLRLAFEVSGWELSGRVDRIGAIPGAGHFPILLEHGHQILRTPGLGQLFGLNWIASARARA